MNITVNMTSDEVISVMKHDCGRYTIDEKKFLKHNFVTYQVALNTWLLIVMESCGFKAARILKGSIMAYGLYNTISDCQEAANSLIAGHGPISDVARELITEDEKETLQCLRYLKRFNPIGADLLAEESVLAFLELNASRKGNPSVIDRKTKKVLEWETKAPRWLVIAVRHYCYEMLKDYSHSQWNQSFTNGTCAEGSKVLIEKLKFLSKYQVNLFDTPLYPIGKSVEEKELPDTVLVVPVPKNYKKNRVIAETHAINNFYLNGVRLDIEQAMSKSELGRRIHLDDQGINQELCRLGSVYNVYATVDLTGASDSIPDSFAKATLPADVYEDVNAYNAKYLEVGGRRIKRYMFQTSGNPTTFCLESVIFLAICQVATDYVELFKGHSCLQPQTYGDDMIVDVDVYETLCDFLEMCGFTVNTEKSFTSTSDYRESCGVEYRLGIDIHSSYYPREQVGSDLASLASLIALQHRIFRYTLASAWLTDYIRNRLLKHNESVDKQQAQLKQMREKEEKASNRSTPTTPKTLGKKPSGDQVKPEKPSATSPKPSNQNKPNENNQNKKNRGDNSDSQSGVKTTNSGSKKSSKVGNKAQKKNIAKPKRSRITITSSPIGTDCDDLWEYVPMYPIINAPFDHKRMEDCDIKREVHMTLKTSYSTVDGLSSSDYDRLEMYYYASWLRNGAPTIESDGDLAPYLAKVNHWTKSIKDVPRDTGIPVSEWKTTNR